MPWKEYELNIKCKKCKTHKKMVCMRKSSKIGFQCMGCHSFYTHPALELVFQFGSRQGEKDLQAELRGLLGAAYLNETLDAINSINNSINNNIKKLEEKSH